MGSYDEKRQSSLKAFAGYGAANFIPPFIEIAYRHFLTHTDEMDIGNTVYLINEMERLRRQSKDFHDVINAFVTREHPTKDPSSSMTAMVILKKAFNIEDQNYEYHTAALSFADDIKKMQEKAAETESRIQKQDAEKKAEGEFRSFDINIMDYEPKEQKAVKQEPKSPNRSGNLSREEQAAEYFSVDRTQKEIDDFLDKFNREAPVKIYKITNDDESMAEYNFLKGKGMYLENFPLNDPDMRNILLEARVIGKDREKKDGSIMREANEKFGVRRLNGIGVSSYYRLAYSVPAIKSFDQDTGRITLMFAREAPVGLKSSHVSIEMPLWKVFDLVNAESKQNAKHVAFFKSHPEKLDMNGMTRKLAIAIRSAQMHSKSVLRKITTRNP